MRCAFPLLVAVLTAGCASVSDLRTKEPVFSGETDKAPEQYAGCVMEAWRAGGLDPSYSPVPNGVEILVRDVGPDLLLRADSVPGRGATVRMASRLPYGYADFAEAARRCQ